MNKAILEHIKMDIKKNRTYRSCLRQETLIDAYYKLLTCCEHKLIADETLYNTSVKKYKI